MQLQISRRGFLTAVVGVAAGLALPIKSVTYGPSIVTAHFRRQWQLQLLKRYNEALALNYVVPFTVDKELLQKLLSQRQQAPHLWNVLPDAIKTA